MPGRPLCASRHLHIPDETSDSNHSSVVTVRFSFLQINLYTTILLAVDQGVAGPALTDGQVVYALGVTERTCQHVRRRAVEQGLMVALERRPRPLPPVPKKLDGEKEARLVQVACSVPLHRKAAFGGP